MTNLSEEANKREISQFFNVAAKIELGTNGDDVSV